MSTEDDSTRGAVLICVTATLAGVVIGFVGGAFRWLLEACDQLRFDLVAWIHHLPGPGWLIPVAITALGATVGALVVQWEPIAQGSGIQHVEAVYRGELPPPQIRLLPAKFVGGLFAIGSGLVLGREGPTVHMGAAIGAEAARRARLPDVEVRMMQTALGGAGLAVAFNAPIGGTLFTLEEVTKTFRTKTVLATLFAGSAAVGCSRLVLGDRREFRWELVTQPGLAWLPLFVAFGLLTGVIGATYNLLILWFLERVTSLHHLPTVAKATMIGAVIGAVMAIQPKAVGGGDNLTQTLLDGTHFSLFALTALLLARLVAGPLSYSAPVVGGLFAPMIAIGALWGVLFARLADSVLPWDMSQLVVPFAIVGMACLFTASVRAPVTGMVLVIEMTATTAVIVPMLAATAAAVLAAHLVGSPPIYDSLRERSLSKF